MHELAAIFLSLYWPGVSTLQLLATCIFSRDYDGFCALARGPGALFLGVVGLGRRGEGWFARFGGLAWLLKWRNATEVMSASVIFGRSCLGSTGGHIFKFIEAVNGLGRVGRVSLGISFFVNDLCQPPISIGGWLLGHVFQPSNGCCALS